MENVEGKDVRNEDHGTGGIRQVAHQFLNAGLLFHLHRNVDVVNFSRFRIVNKLVIVARPVRRYATRFRVVVDPNHFKT